MALIGYVVIALVIIRFDRVLMRLVRTENDAQRRYNAEMVDCLGNISTVLILRLQNATRHMLNNRLAAVFEPLKRAIMVNEGKWCAVDLLSITLSWMLVALYAWSAKNANGTLLLGDVFMVYQYTQQAAGVVGSIAVNFQSFARMYTDYSCADNIWQAKVATEGKTLVAPDWQRIDIDDLRFSYGRRKGDEHALESLSLTLRRGERIALVGSSGSGKSTLMRLLAGLYRAQEGVFKVDGIAHQDLRHLGSVATLIPQDAEVFEGSVRDNITFGVEYPEAIVDNAIRLAGFDAVAQALPQGLETMISERGLNLSGGQRQRLALARGFLAASGSSVLMLDEPTSSLDALTESRIFEGLKAAMPDACIVSSVHRLNLLPRFDRTVLMHNGHVIDAGAVDELRARQPLFEELWQRSTGTPVLAAAA
jgi:ABC-type multidrug transport system fused ATPase/permease subunit